MMRKRIFKIYTAILSVGLIYLLWIRLTGLKIPCLYLLTTGLQCPGCGMTRALWALLRLDFAAAFSWNPLIYAMPYVFCYVFFPMDEKIHRRILAIIGIAALINWLCRVLILWI